LNSMITTPDSDRPWFNQDLECMRQEEREKMVLKKLRSLLKYVYNNSIYYHEVLKDIDLDSIDSLEDYSRKIPLTTKAIIREEQSLYPPYGRLIASSIEDVAMVLASSGTTGKPTYIPFSREDLDSIADAHARIMWSFGVRPRMRIMIAALFSLYAGSWGVYLGARLLGLGILPIGAGVAGMTRQAIRVALDWRPEILYGTPSYIMHFIETAREASVDMRGNFGFKIVFGSGEPGLSLPSVKKKIKDALGDHVRVIDTGSMVEAMPWMTNAECVFENGMHLWQDIVYTELVDPGNGDLKSYGEEGVLTYTPLVRRLYPVIRYYSGDISMWIDDPCPCGRTYPRLPKGIYGRVDDMFIAKGVKLWPSTIQDILLKSKYFGGEFRIVLTREKEVDTLRLLVEVSEEAWRDIERDRSNMDKISHELRTLVRDSLGINTIVEIAPPGSLERATHKAKRIADEREIYKELERLRRGGSG